MASWFEMVKDPYKFGDEPIEYVCPICQGISIREEYLNSNGVYTMEYSLHRPPTLLPEEVAKEKWLKIGTFCSNDECNHRLVSPEEILFFDSLDRRFPLTD